MTKIETFAELYRLRVTRDECNERLIQGRRGQLHFDGAELCLMVLDGKPANRSKWKALGGKLWMGDISKECSRRAGSGRKDYQHPAENAVLAILMVGARQKRVLSETRKAELALAGNSTRFGANGLLIEGLTRGILPPDPAAGLAAAFYGRPLKRRAKSRNSGSAVLIMK
jgi:hypothetical protein